MKRLYLLGAVILFSSCARRVEVSRTAEWKGSCTINSWWIEVPRDMSIGDQSTVQVKRCEGKRTPAKLEWTTSDPSILQLVSTNSDAAVIKGVGKGMASIIANSADPVGRAENSVTVK